MACRMVAMLKAGLNLHCGGKQKKNGMHLEISVELMMYIIILIKLLNCVNQKITHALSSCCWNVFVVVFDGFNKCYQI